MVCCFHRARYMFSSLFQVNGFPIVNVTCHFSSRPTVQYESVTSPSTATTSCSRVLTPSMANSCYAFQIVPSNISFHICASEKTFDFQFVKTSQPARARARRALQCARHYGPSSSGPLRSMPQVRPPLTSRMRRSGLEKGRQPHRTFPATSLFSSAGQR
jgi:hypothetical protein